MDNLPEDKMLLEILLRYESMSGFFDAIFGFLRRNTDFYHIKKHESEQIGFPKAMREQIVFAALQRYNPDIQLKTTSEVSGDGGTPAPCKQIEEKTEMSDSEPDSNTEHPSESPRAASTKLKLSFTAADYKNGALLGDYCWSQTPKDMELQLTLPPNLETKKSIKVEANADSISVKNQDHTIVSGKLNDKIKHNDIVWSIDGGILRISFDKRKEMWWDRLFITESPIDLKKVDNEIFIDELPPESRAAIHQLQVQQIEKERKSQIEQNEKQQSKLQEDSMEKLRKAWDQDDSPFKGQPFDPSKVVFQ